MLETLYRRAIFDCIKSSNVKSRYKVILCDWFVCVYSHSFEKFKFSTFDYVCLKDQKSSDDSWSFWKCNLTVFCFWFLMPRVFFHETRDSFDIVSKFEAFQMECWLLAPKKAEMGSWQLTKYQTKMAECWKACFFQSPFLNKNYSWIRSKGNWKLVNQK